MTTDPGTPDPGTPDDRRPDARGPSTPPLPAQVGLLVLFLAVAISAGLVGNLLQGSDVDVRYLELDRPAWAPPSWLFGVVWPVLYVLIGLAPWWLWRTTGGFEGLGLPLGLWAGQLVLNAIWPGVFFGAEAFWAAVAVIVPLVAVVVATILVFGRRSRLAAALLVPYLLWISYATALNIAIAAAN